jgi:hypothetical protein
VSVRRRAFPAKAIIDVFATECGGVGRKLALAVVRQRVPLKPKVWVVGSEDAVNVLRHTVPDGPDLEGVGDRPRHRCERLVELRRTGTGGLAHARDSKLRIGAEVQPTARLASCSSCSPELD